MYIHIYKKYILLLARKKLPNISPSPNTHTHARTRARRRTHTHTHTHSYAELRTREKEKKETKTNKKRLNGTFHKMDVYKDAYAMNESFKKKKAL